MQNFVTYPSAVAWVRGGEDAPQLSGEVRFYQERGRVLVVARFRGLPVSKTGFFAFHIHMGESCAGTAFSETMGHYAPGGEAHPNHAGDLPPLLSCRSEAYLAVWTDRFRVQDVIGKTVVIHADPDDFHSQPAGNAGKKIACGVISHR